MAVTLANILLGSSTVSVDDTDVGAIRGPVAISRESEYLRVMCEQLTGTPKVQLITEGYAVSFIFLELTLENLGLGLFGETGYLTGVDFGGDDSPESVTLDVYGTNPAGFARTIEFDAAVFIEPGDLTMGKEDIHHLPAKALILADATDGHFGAVVDAAI